MTVPAELVRTPSDRAAVDAGCWFDAAAGDRVIRFVETFLVPTRGFGAEKAAKLMPWQRQLLTELFGWKKADGRRRYRFGLWGIPRQNGKSFMASAVLLYMLLADDEPGSYCVASAVTGEQTGVVYDEILNSVRANEALSEALEPIPSQRVIRFPARNGLLKGLSSEGWGKLGRPPHCGVMDEFCFWRNYKPYEALKTGMDSRRQPLLLAISTSGHDRTSVGHELWSYAQGVQNGSITDPAFYAAVYAAHPDEAIDDPGTWRKANPSLGVTVQLEETAAWAARAKHSKTEELQFRQYRLNQWVTSVRQFLDLDRFALCGLPPEQWPDLSAAPCYVGVDMSQTRDLTSVAVLTPFMGLVYLEHHSFCCRQAVEKREAQNLVRYGLFAEEGTLTVCEGNIIDFDQVREYIRGVAERRDVKAIAFDQREASDTVLILQGEGLPVTVYPPGPLYFDTPLKRFESWVNDGKLRHAGDSLIRWQAQNLEVKRDGRDLMNPVKPQGNDAAKIDTLVAALIAAAKLIAGEAQATADAAAGPWCALA